MSGCHWRWNAYTHIEKTVSVLDDEGKEYLPSREEICDAKGHNMDRCVL